MSKDGVPPLARQEAEGQLFEAVGELVDGVVEDIRGGHLFDQLGVRNQAETVADRSGYATDAFLAPDVLRYGISRLNTKAERELFTRMLLIQAGNLFKYLVLAELGTRPEVKKLPKTTSGDDEMAKAKPKATGKKTEKAHEKPKPAKPGTSAKAKEFRKVVAKPAAKPPLKELKPGGGTAMTVKKLAGITDKKGLTHFLLRYPFGFFLDTDGVQGHIDRDVERAACPPGYEAQDISVQPFAIKKPYLLVAVEARVVPLPDKPAPVPTPEPAAPPDAGPPPVEADPRTDLPATATNTPAGETTASADEFEPVAARVHSDDREAEATFDAQEWFKQASDEDILNLAREEYQYEATSDAIAEFMAARDEKVKEVMDYVAGKNATATAHGKEPEGFGCSVDEAQAVDWVEKFRPHLMDQLAKIKDGEDEAEKGEPAALPG